MNWDTVWQLGAEITTVVGFIVFLFKGFHALSRRFDKQDEDLATIKHELFPNSGGSLRDQVDRIRLEQGRQRKRIRRLEREQDGGQP